MRSQAGTAVAEDDEEEENDDDDDDANGNNRHLLVGPSGPSRYVGYYDAASLYPSSGE